MSEYAERTTAGATQSGSDPAASLRDVLTFPYRSYLYSYPHKTAYRELNPPIPLQSLWEKEDTETYFLYMHIPFCAARCGFAICSHCRTSGRTAMNSMWTHLNVKQSSGRQ